MPVGAATAGVVQVVLVRRAADVRHPVKIGYIHLLPEIVINIDRLHT